MRRAAPNRRDELVDKDGLPSPLFASTLENLVSDVNDLGASPINTQDSDYTLVLQDAGQILRKTSSTINQVYTIPDNDSVQFEIGDKFEVQNDGSVALKVAITTDTLIFEADGTTGTRTIAAAGSGRFVKVDATRWKCRGEQMT